MATNYSHICLQLDKASDPRRNAGRHSRPPAHPIPQGAHLASTPIEWEEGKGRNENESTKIVQSGKRRTEP